LSPLVRYLTTKPPQSSYTSLSEGIDEGIPDKRNKRKVPSLWLINFNTFAMNVEYSCLMPTAHKVRKGRGTGKGSWDLH
jgi:hypothetical protein